MPTTSKNTVISNKPKEISKEPSSGYTIVSVKKPQLAPYFKSLDMKNMNLSYK